jgi:hypothetical protein
MAVMSTEWQDETLNELAEAIRSTRSSDELSIRRASVEPYLDADGEAALKAVVIVDPPGDNGWSAEFTHALRREVNRLAASHRIGEHVYVTLFTQEEFDALEDGDEPAEVNSTGAIDQALTRDQQDRS